MSKNGRTIPKDSEEKMLLQKKKQYRTERLNESLMVSFTNIAGPFKLFFKKPQKKTWILNYKKSMFELAKKGSWVGDEGSVI